MLLDGKPVGTVQVRHEGLYSLLILQFDRDTDALFRLYAQTEHTAIYIGICTPLHKQEKRRISQSSFPSELCNFQLVVHIPGQYIRQRLSGQPLENISHLKASRLIFHDGMAYAERTA